MNRPAPHTIVAVDLETTGLDFDRDLVIEVGLVACPVDAIATADIDSLPTFHAVLPIAHLHRDEWENIMTPEVHAMHTASGLLDDVERAPMDPEWMLDWEVRDWLQCLSLHGSDTPGSVVLAGSGVERFDRRWCEELLPSLVRASVYWAYDVSSTRRILELAGAAHLTISQEHKAHRALADARSHLAELQHYVRLFGSSAEERCLRRPPCVIPAFGGAL